MSQLFGPVVQQGYVVPDIDAAIEHWVERGVGPFFVEHLVDFDGIYDGEPVKLELKAGFAYWGDQQIEVIQPLGDQPSIYSDYLRENPEGGLQHVAVWVDEIGKKMKELEAAGKDYTIRQSYGDSHAYIDSKDKPGMMIQLMKDEEGIRGMFAIIEEGAETWDGKSNPKRRIDWSTGSPVVENL
ncbi:MAG: VOC family protein [Alphaproteobacteria bacterium]|nr:VOC family protein [Alphaproteobacteria bacterium]